MLTTVQGVYRQGTIELVERPPNVQESRVLVTFLETQPTSKLPKPMVFGQFSGPRSSTEEEFLTAEWHGEAAAEDGDHVRR